MTCSVIWAFFFFLSWCVYYFKGRSLRCSSGRGNAGCCAVTLYVGEGPRGSNGARFPIHRISVFHSATHNQTGPLWCWFLSGCACARPRPLWVSPTTSPVRLGVSPAAAPTPTGVFNQRFEALFPRAGALGCAGCFAPRRLSGLSVSECGDRGVLPATACPALRHSESGLLGLSARTWGRRVCQKSDCLPRWSHTLPVSVRHGHVSPVHPGARLRPSYRSGCMFFFYLLGVGLPCPSIFCQFWLCEEVQCVYLRRHLGSPLFVLLDPLTSSPIPQNLPPFW